MFHLEENISPKMGKIRYNGWFYKMEMVPFDIIIFTETGWLLFTKPIEIFKTLSVRIVRLNYTWWNSSC